MVETSLKHSAIDADAGMCPTFTNQNEGLEGCKQNLRSSGSCRLPATPWFHLPGTPEARHSQRRLAGGNAIGGPLLLDVSVAVVGVQGRGRQPAGTRCLQAVLEGLLQQRDIEKRAGSVERAGIEREN